MKTNDKKLATRIKENWELIVIALGIGFFVGFMMGGFIGYHDPNGQRPEIGRAQEDWVNPAKEKGWIDGLTERMAGDHWIVGILDAIHLPTGAELGKEVRAFLDKVGELPTINVAVTHKNAETAGQTQ